MIGERIEADHPQIKYGKGYDHTWVVNQKAGESLAHAATLRDPGSGRVMEIYTDQPGIQFYAGNYLDGSFSGQEGKYIPSGRVCAWRPRFFPTAPIIKGKKDGKVAS